MANLYLRLSSSFASVPVKLVVGWKRETVFARVVGGVHFEGTIIGFLLKCKQKTKKDKPKKTKKEFRLSSFFAYTSIKNQFMPIQNRLFRQLSEGCFLFTSSDKFNWYTSKRRRKSKKEVCHS